MLFQVLRNTMRKIIHKVDIENKIFYIKGRLKLHAYKLSNRMSKTYLPILAPGLLIDFEAAPQKHLKHVQKVTHITQIVMLEPYVILHDIDALRTSMLDVIRDVKHFAYLDFEMSMPSFSHKGTYQTEIIQYGIVITDENHHILETHESYVFKKRHGLLSNRTLKFLKIPQESYLEGAVSYREFYELMKDIQMTYDPKWIVWGKNDIQVLQDSFDLHGKEPFVNANNFMDLLKLHKDYYSLKDDLGLVKAFKLYVDDDIYQKHDALDDAKMTAVIMRGFIKTMKAHKKNRPRRIDLKS